MVASKFKKDNRVSATPVPMQKSVNFYVDDGLASFPSEAEAISILQTSQAMLTE